MPARMERSVRRRQWLRFLLHEWAPADRQRPRTRLRAQHLETEVAVVDVALAEQGAAGMRGVDGPVATARRFALGNHRRAAALERHGLGRALHDDDLGGVDGAAPTRTSLHARGSPPLTSRNARSSSRSTRRSSFPVSLYGSVSRTSITAGTRD